MDVRYRDVGSSLSLFKDINMVSDFGSLQYYSQINSLNAPTNVLERAHSCHDSLTKLCGVVTTRNVGFKWWIGDSNRQKEYSPMLMWISYARFKDVALWNSLISGLFLNFDGEKALCYFRRMRLCGEKVDEITMVGVLSGCADMAALSNGRQVHGLGIKNGFGLHLPVGNALLDMYAKCGFMDDACVCFDSLPYKNVVSWTSLIMGFGKHGLGSSALKAFDRMEIEGYSPNKITFVGVLFACCHSGLVDEGWKCFNSMINRYSITPIMEHYTCMVDLLARAGFLEEAFEFIERMPVNPDARLLTALLSSCFYHKNTELTRNIGNKLLDLEPKEAGPYMLLSNFYGLLGDFEGVAKVRRLMHKRGIRKEKAYTWIEIDKRIHRFESGDRSHPLYKSIYAYLSELVAKMRTKGYVPNKSVVALRSPLIHSTFSTNRRITKYFYKGEFK
ncbi:hypothetical protein Scep_028792 [Stephania cephalantha]|uniref:Pentatricopeptide repeat-containing protein n=1 Tax=Stephania cephalantha TaxID=152367 RepID=A0AAP0EAM3_9MAGN